MSYNYQPPKAPFDERPDRPHNSFYESIRSWRVRREPDRWVGGVAAGIARATGLDVALVRGLLALLAILATPLTLVAYAVLWALIPERVDGRIHLEEFQYGRFDIAHLGIGIMALFGLFGVAGVFRIDYRGNWGGYFTFLTTAAAIALVVVIVLTIVRLFRERNHPYDPRGRANPPYDPPRPYGAPNQQGFHNAFEGMGPNSAPEATGASSMNRPSEAGAAHLSGFPNTESAEASSNASSDVRDDSIAEDAADSSTPEGTRPDTRTQNDSEGNDQEGGAPVEDSDLGQSDQHSAQTQAHHDGMPSSNASSEWQPRPDYGQPNAYSRYPGQGGYGQDPRSNGPRNAPYPQPYGQAFYPPLNSNYQTAPAPSMIPPYRPPQSRTQQGPGISTFLFITGVLLLVTAITWLLWSMGLVFDPTVIMTTTVGVAFVLTGLILAVRALRGQPGTWLTGLAIVVTVLLPGFLLVVAGMTSYTTF